MDASRRLELVTRFFYFDHHALHYRGCKCLLSSPRRMHLTITHLTTTSPSMIDSCQTRPPMLTLQYVLCRQLRLASCILWLG
jgi:hypothetical protein